MEIKQCLFTIKDMQEVITKKDNNEYLLLENAEMKQGKHFFPYFSCQRQTAHLMRDQVKPTLLIMKNWKCAKCKFNTFSHYNNDLNKNKMTKVHFQNLFPSN